MSLHATPRIHRWYGFTLHNILWTIRGQNTREVCNLHHFGRSRVVFHNVFLIEFTVELSSLFHASYLSRHHGLSTFPKPMPN